MTEPKLRVLSLGAGVQSTTLALMAAHGEIEPMPDCAIFADTGWEPAAIYQHLDWLESVLPFSIERVKRDGPDLGEHAMAVAAGQSPRKGSCLPPWFVSEPASMMPKQCTKEFKVRVITKAIRQKIGLVSGQRGPSEPVVEQWLGISTDEMVRMKDHETRFVKNRWPLIERRMSRGDCLAWMRSHSYPEPKKSSCIFCPYRRADQWREMQETAPEDWRRAVDFDRHIRAGYLGMGGQAFVHKSRVPLDQIDTTPSAQTEFGFLEECDGMCGV